MPLYRHPKSPYWWVRFSIGGIKTRCSTQTTDRQAAEEFEAKLRSDRWRQVRLGERPKYLWSQAVERWYGEADSRDKEHEKGRLKWFAEYLDCRTLESIDRSLIDQLRKVKAAETSPANANRLMAVLRMILRKAHREWDWIEKAPVVPMYRLEKLEPRFLRRTEFAHLLKALPPHLKDLASFAVETGLRMSNVTGLRWDQVDLRRKQLIVPAIDAKAGETLAVPLSSKAHSIIKSWRGRHSERVFVFRGKPIKKCNGPAFRKAVKAAGLAWLRWHDLRHTWASWHVQSGTPLHVLQELGGWKSLAMCQRYAHLSTEHLRAYAEHRKGTPVPRGTRK
ncbi:MAG: integrase [Gammaproteobacteria bacterium]|nr:integrase [Gammaproteobacteria bacterium]